jgi:glycosyltransferase involved in cell wall biosynthesis
VSNYVGWLYYGALLTAVGKLLGKPVIWSFHATALDREHFRLATRCAICRLSSWRVPEHIHYCSEEGRISHRAAGFCDSRAVVIDNVVDPRLFVEFRQMHDVDRTCATAKNGATGASVDGHPAPTYKIGCAARFEHQKDHDTLFGALNILRERGMSFECRLAGAGCEPGNARLMEMIRHYGLVDHVVLLGFVSRMGEFYRGIDLLVLSSAYGESMPLAVLEAAALGRPIVATDVGATRSLVGPLDEIVPPRSPQKLADAVDCVLKKHAAFSSPNRNPDRPRVPTVAEYIAKWHRLLFQFPQSAQSSPGPPPGRL